MGEQDSTLTGSRVDRSPSLLGGARGARLSVLLPVIAVGLAAAASVRLGGSLDAYVLHVAVMSLVWALFASGWNLSFGFAGIKSLGHQGFFAVGA